MKSEDVIAGSLHYLMTAVEVIMSIDLSCDVFPGIEVLRARAAV